MQKICLDVLVSLVISGVILMPQRAEAARPSELMGPTAEYGGALLAAFTPEDPAVNIVNVRMPIRACPYP